MTPIEIAATGSTPYIHFSPDRALLELRGESYPENALSFYEPLILALEAYFKNPDNTLEIRLDLCYMNTSSIKSLMDILDLADDAHQMGTKVQVLWYHDPEDDRSLEVAEEFCEDLKLPFKTLIKPINDQ